MYNLIYIFLTVWQPILFNICPGIIMICCPRKWNRIWCRQHFVSSVVIKEYGLIMIYLGIAQLCIFQMIVSYLQRIFLITALIIEWRYANMMAEEYRDTVLVPVTIVLLLRLVEIAWWIICF